MQKTQLTVNSWGGALEEEGSEWVGACSVPTLAVEAAVLLSSPDSDSVSVRSRGHFMMGAASMKLKGSTSVPLPKKVTRTRRVKSSLVSDPARAMVRCCKPSFLSATAFPFNSAASRKRRSD